MVNFKEGQLIKVAYVLIDGVKHEVHMPEYSGSTPLSPEILNKMQVELLKDVFPIGSTYITPTNTNPSMILGFGTWERLKGKVCVGLDENDDDFKTIGKTGGVKTHNHKETLQFTSTYAASNGVKYTSGDTVPTGAINTADSTNLMPYRVVGYMWIRTV